MESRIACALASDTLGLPLYNNAGRDAGLERISSLELLVAWDTTPAA
jgi:hypothetical protein